MSYCSWPQLWLLLGQNTMSHNLKEGRFILARVSIRNGAEVQKGAEENREGKLLMSWQPGSRERREEARGETGPSRSHPVATPADQHTQLRVQHPMTQSPRNAWGTWGHPRSKPWHLLSLMKMTASATGTAKSNGRSKNSTRETNLRCSTEFM